MFAFAFGLTAAATAQTTVDLPKVVVNALRVANPEPADTFAMPVTALRFEPQVDVQGRNFAESQADVSIRGGIFENTGFRVGAVTLLDPQTGHYFAEVPVAPAMLATPAILTGADNATGSTNVTVGTVAYGWKPIRRVGRISVGAGTHGLRLADFYQGVAANAGAGGTWAADISYAVSTGDGTQPYGDHDFSRVAGRVQFRTAEAQTDAFIGYQAKFFGWPNLYTPFGVNETENLQTTLAVLNHRVSRRDGGHVEVGVYARRNKDDYEYNRLIPGQFNPYQHESRVTGLAVDGREVVDTWAWRYRLEAIGDKLDSPSLPAGRYSSRDLYKASLVAEHEWSAAAGGRWTAGLGGTWDDSNRGAGRASPVAEVTRHFAPGMTWQHVTLGYSEATQVPTYTALNSATGSGLFRGNPNVGREVSRNLELSGSLLHGGWEIDGALFVRQDDGLVDWTYRQGVTARTANPVDIRTTGFEVVARRDFKRGSITLGYTALTKDADYGAATIDASFYALNYARHRLTAALVWRPTEQWELRMDNEARLQAKNSLRTMGGDEALLTALALIWHPPGVERLELSLQADNLWDSDYQEVPAVPASGRQVVVGAAYRW